MFILQIIFKIARLNIIHVSKLRPFGWEVFTFLSGSLDLFVSSITWFEYSRLLAPISLTSHNYTSCNKHRTQLPARQLLNLAKPKLGKPQQSIDRSNHKAMRGNSPNQFWNTASCYNHRGTCGKYTCTCKPHVLVLNRRDINQWMSFKKTFSSTGIK